MKVIEILRESANLLGLEDVYDLLSTEDETQESALLENEDVKKLFCEFKFSSRELCTNYVPICKREQITTTEQMFPLNKLNNYIRMMNVYDGEQLVKYKLLNRNLVFEKDAVYDVEYLTYPEINSIFEEVDFLSNFSPDALIYGLCAYYSVAKGLFAEFEAFYEKYIHKAESLKGLRMFTLPQRRWE